MCVHPRYDERRACWIHKEEHNTLALTQTRRGDSRRKPPDRIAFAQREPRLAGTSTYSVSQSSHRRMYALWTIPSMIILTSAISFMFPFYSQRPKNEPVFLRVWRLSVSAEQPKWPRESSWKWLSYPDHPNPEL